MEGSAPDFNDKPFFHSFSIPARTEVAADNLLNEIMADKKKG